MKKETYELLKVHEERLDLILNHDQKVEPTFKTDKALLAAQKDMWPDEKPCCDSCIDCFTDKVKEIATAYFEMKKSEEPTKPNKNK